jgi:hypothetical protein
MKEEKTQGIDTEKPIKDRYNTNKTTDYEELLDLRAGYVQHTSPILLYTTIFQNPNQPNARANTALQKTKITPPLFLPMY